MFHILSAHRKKTPIRRDSKIVLNHQIEKAYIQDYITIRKVAADPVDPVFNGGDAI